MSGIILLFILAIWFYSVKKISWFCISKIQSGTKKAVIHKVLFVLIFIAPVADDIIGGFQFRALCKQGAKLIYDVEKVRGKTVLWSGMPRTKIKNTIIPIEESIVDWVDVNTGEILIKYKEYYATGGWLSRFIAFNSVTRPYTFHGVCGVKDELIQLQNELNIERKYR